MIITSNPHKVPLTEKLDKIVTNRILGIPIFLLIMYFMFMLTFDWLGFPLSDLLDAFISVHLHLGYNLYYPLSGLLHLYMI